MSFKSFLKGIRDGYVTSQVEHIKLPKFEKSNVVRKNIIFSGKVQKVGFRLEVYLIATKVGLTGWVKNREDGSVEAEIQGEKDKIDFLKEFMCSLKRAKVTDIKEINLLVKDEDKEFSIIYE